MMGQNKLIAPSILSADFANLEMEIKALAKAGADWIHVDVMDGHFVPNITLGMSQVQALKRVSPLPLDVHLMIENPERYAQKFAQAGSDYLTFHIESLSKNTLSDSESFFKQVRQWGSRPGLTLRPGTSLQDLQPHLGFVDLVLVMTVEPGFGGQSFRSDQIAKIQELAHWRETSREHMQRKETSREHMQRKEPSPLNYLIEVDGGLNEQTAQHCLKADVWVAGNFIFGGDYQKNITKLKNIR